MENVRSLQWHFGGSWTAVKFYFDSGDVPDIRVAEDIHFCEAVSRAKSSPLLLNPEGVSCPGARYVLGWSGDSRERIVAELMGRRGIGPEAAEKLIDQVPVLDRPPLAIGFNTEDVPDLIISYCQPRTAMDFLSVWQTAFGGSNLTTDLSSILSVCGNVGVGAYLSESVSLSLGCEDARRFAGISRDRMVIGLPYPLIKEFSTRTVGRESANLSQAAATSQGED
jgi:uncharacterized protein (DUF169 family)